MTIMKRVLSALRAHGNTAEADELENHVGKLGASFDELSRLLDRKEATVKLLITTVQHRCPHHEWTFAQVVPPNVMTCYVCGLSVHHEEVEKLAKKVRSGGHYIFVRAGGRVTPPNYVRAAIKSQLITIEQVRHANQETLRASGKGNAEEPAPANVPHAEC